MSGGGGEDGIRLMPRHPAIDHMDRHDAQAPAAGDKKQMLFWTKWKVHLFFEGWIQFKLDFDVFIWRILTSKDTVDVTWKFV